jgi:two-component system chemotaxis response regulator CheB
MKKKKLILIGSSTGGPGHLEKILSALPHDFSSTIIIAQHIAHIFLPSMIKSMNARCAVEVIQAGENEIIRAPIVVFASKNITNLHYNPINGLCLRKCTEISHYQPCVDSLFASASKLSSHYDILACQLTGIGDDGAQGMLSLREAGALCINENEQSSIVYGMPKAAYDLGASSQELSLEQIIAKIITF